MIAQRLENLRTVLCLGAHADDIEIGCGGTLLKFQETYAPLNVYWVVLSSGGPRTSEAKSSAAYFLQGAAEKQVVIKSFPDSFFPYEAGPIKHYFHALSREVSPDLILTHRREDLHQDHRFVAELTWNAFRNHLIWEYEIPKYEGDLGHPNTYVALDESYGRRKLAGLLEHFPSQRNKPWFSQDTFEGLLRIRGLECNAPGRIAEAFTCRKAIW
jgi:LmbE family N-acetylglucosaminyl deacetylase